MKLKMTFNEAFEVVRGLESPQLNDIKDGNLSYAVEKSRRLLGIAIKNLQSKPPKGYNEYRREIEAIDKKYKNIRDFEKDVKQAEIDEVEKKYKKVNDELEKLELAFEEKMNDVTEFEVHSFKKEKAIALNLTTLQMKAIYPILED